MNMQEQEVDQMIVHYLLGIQTSEEKIRLTEWVSHSSENKAFFDRICDQEALGSRYNHYQEVDVKEAYRDFLDRTDSFHVGGSRFRRIVKYAAILMLPLLAGATFWMIREAQPKRYSYSGIALASLQQDPRKQATLVLNTGVEIPLSSGCGRTIWDGFSMQAVNSSSGLSYAVCTNAGLREWNEVKTPLGAEYTVTLSDGTVVRLNSGSRLRFPVEFDSKSRTVSLYGEAFFKVAKDKARPFSIQTDQIVIKEYGTSFNVNTFRPEVIQVVLVEGSVGVLTRNPAKEISLKPSQLAEYNRRSNQVTVKDVNVLPFIAWSDGLFVFEDEPLSSIMSTLSRWYKLKVRFSNPEMARIRFTGSLSRETSLNDIVKTIQFTTDVRMAIRGNEVLVTNSTLN
jgi:transmembrane sensor